MISEMHLVSNSPRETQKIAAEIAGKLQFNIIALEGELGAGKTTFVKGFARAFGVKEKITSPTFVLMKCYKLQVTGYKFLYHIDAYRLKNYRDLVTLGIKEIISDRENVVLIEWSDRVGQVLPRKYLKIHLDHIDRNTRKVSINAQTHSH